MSYKNIHLHLFVDPVPTSHVAVDNAFNLAARFGARLHVSSPRLKITTRANLFGASMVKGMANKIEQEAAANGAALDSYVAERAGATGVTALVSHPVEKWPRTLGDGTWYARTSDLCVLGLERKNADQQAAIEDWIFSVGRPCLLIPGDAPSDSPFDEVVVSWDYSRSAARAVADAIPILRKAKNVRIVTVRGEKDLPMAEIGAPLVAFFADHGISGAAEEIQAGSKTIGQALLSRAADAKANLIVMGAFGHSRLREFILGGATKELLETSNIPLFMSH